MVKNANATPYKIKKSDNTLRSRIFSVNVAALSFKQAPTEEKAVSRSRPDINTAKSKITNDITYIEKNPQTEVATLSSTLLVPTFKVTTEFG